ncbi:MAG: outer membrane beta-barrel protein, partial [Pirellulaceae bacterium]|nr:outer membrane beta-barrel protein [Pirellulaceae bacterium]
MLLGTVSAASAQSQQAPYQPAGIQQNNVAQVNCCAGPVCGCEVTCAAPPTCSAPPPCPPAPACGCEMACPPGACCAEPTCAAPTYAAPGCGCEYSCDGGCDSGCFGGGGCAIGSCLGGGGGGCGLGSCLGGDCCLGDPYTLFGEYEGLSVGGWVSIGYHNKALPFLFNSHPDQINVHQTWLYAEKVADGSCGLGLGGRIDYVYGVDAQDTQAFGIDDDHWDNAWDHGIYGSAMPQLYVEAAYGNTSVKFGH